MSCENAVLGDDCLPLVEVQRSHFDRLVIVASRARNLLFLSGASIRKPDPQALAIAQEPDGAIREIQANAKEVAAR